MALRALLAAELVQVRVGVALVAETAYLRVRALLRVAVLAYRVVMDALQGVAGLLGVVEVPRPPVILRMARGALLVLELLLMRVLVAVLADFLFFLVLVLPLVALGALGGLMGAYKGELRLGIVVHRRFFPVERVVAVLADAPQFLLVDVLLNVAGYARLFYRLVLIIDMALGAFRLLVLSLELVRAVLLGVMVEYQLLPVVGP